jgi:CubicO group peptidase (beta-lactamase class C family)
MYRSKLWGIPLIAFLFFAAQWIKPDWAPNDDFVNQADQFYAESLALLESVPGAAVLVVKDGRTHYQKGFGLADVERELPFTPNTNFYIASCTKAFTGLMAAQLDREGILKLEDRLADHFPEIDFHEDLRMDKLRLIDLLTHSSGLANDPIGFRVAYSGEHSLDKLIGLLKVSEPNREGYGNFRYTNVGYNIYTLVVEKVTGKPWQQLLEEKVFAPLGMDRTTAYMSRADKHKWPLAAPYMGFGKNDRRRVYLRKEDNTMQSAGGLITTASDLSKWLIMQLDQGQLEGRQVFPRDMIGQSQRSLVKNDDPREPFPSEGYGLGWHRGTYEDQPVIWHYGGFPGALTHISFMPEANTGVAVFINDAVSGYRLMNLFANFAYDYLAEGEHIIPDYREKVKSLSQELKDRQKGLRDDIKKRRGREWQLSHPFSFYSGVFENELYGKVIIEGSPDTIKVRMGNLHCTATPFTRAETARVELIPYRGEVIRFVIENGKLTGLHHSDAFFEKVE